MPPIAPSIPNTLFIEVSGAGIPEIDGLEVQLAHNIERDVIEGTSHTGLASVTQIIATLLEN